MNNTLVSGWFGPQFDALHPLLQQLHRQGGVLKGVVDLRYGRGWAGWLGRRLASRMGLPPSAGPLPLEVTIAHSPRALVWSRRFGAAHTMTSLFEPVGQWPHGHWMERTGALCLRLTVDVRDGGWYWRVLGARLHGIPMPIAWLPQSHAYKRIEGQAYRFSVSFVAPVLGLLMSYGGDLHWTPPLSEAPETPADSPPRSTCAAESDG